MTKRYKANLTRILNEYVTLQPKVEWAPALHLFVNRGPELNLFLVILLSAFALADKPAPLSVLPADGVQWEFPQTSRVIAIGDLHADPKAFLEILHSQGLIDKAGHWSGGNTTLVFTGDAFDRGPNSRAVIDILINLEEEAKRAGGHVESLMGNHDMMILQGDIRYTKDSEMAGYADFQNTPEAKELIRQGSDKEAAGFLAAFRGNTKYAEWMARRNTMLKIGDTLYVHAGVGNWPETTSPAGINATVRAWIRHFQGKEQAPADSFNWVLDGSSMAGGTSGKSPFWMRELAEGKIPEAQLDAIMAYLGVKHIVIGHTPTSSAKIEEMYGGKVIRIDTNISEGYITRPNALSALEIAHGEIIPHDGIPRPPRDGKCDLAATAVINPSSSPGFFSRLLSKFAWAH